MSKANFTIIENFELTVLKSYQTVVAAYNRSDGTLWRTSEKWSVTTSKHLNQFEQHCKPQQTFFLDQAVLENFVRAGHFI